MAYIPNRDDPFMPRPAQTPEEIRRNERLDRELQADPELAEGPASGGRVAIYVVAILVVLGALFYGLNVANNTSQTASTPTANPPASTAQNTPAKNTPANPAAPTPNTGAGVTTGSAPANPAPSK